MSGAASTESVYLNWILSLIYLFIYFLFKLFHLWFMTCKSNIIEKKVPIVRLWVLWWKFAKFLMFLWKSKSVSKLQVTFSSNFPSLFSVMKDNSSVLFKVKLYVVCTKLLRIWEFWVLRSKFTKFLSFL